MPFTWNIKIGKRKKVGICSLLGLGLLQAQSCAVADANAHLGRSVLVSVQV